ncbi:MAG: IclR family transcriptional regulator [Rhodoglobus sp.]
MSSVTLVSSVWSLRAKLCTVRANFRSTGGCPRAKERDTANQSKGQSALSRAVKILEAFSYEAPTLRLSALAARSGVPLSSTQRIVQELVAHEMLERMPDRSYRVGTRIWEIGTRTPGALGLRGIALPYLNVVQSRVRQHVQLVVRADLDALVIERLSARDAVVNASIVGGRMPLQHVSSGLVLLAACDEKVLDRVIQRGLEQLTPHSLRNESELRAAVEIARREGYAVSEGRIFEGSRGIAVPVQGPQGECVAAISIVEPNDGSSAMNHVNLLRQAAAGIADALLRSHLPAGHPDAPPGGPYRALVNSSEQSMEFFEHHFPRHS